MNVIRLYMPKRDSESSALLPDGVRDCVIPPRYINLRAPKLS